MHSDREAVSERACIGCTLPVPPRSLAGVGAFLPLAVLVRRLTSAPRLMVEAFVTTLAVIALVWLAWVALWLVEQRW